MKKLLFGSMVLAGLLLLVSCGPKEYVGPADFSNSNITRAPIVVPTCTPKATPTPDPALQPKVTPTKAPVVTSTVTPEPTAEPTPEPTATPTVAPTKKPTVTPTPTAEPAKPTPEVTPTAIPTSVPTVVPTEAPALSDDEMLRSGWQQTVSVEETHRITFPEVFSECTIERTGSELVVRYTCPEDIAITFTVTYRMQSAIKDSLDEIFALEEAVISASTEENQAVCLWQEDGKIHRGIFIGIQYPQSLLGSAFGEEEQIPGVMQVVFSYPADNREMYETSEYNYYVIENREE